MKNIKNKKRICIGLALMGILMIGAGSTIIIKNSKSQVEVNSKIETNSDLSKDEDVNLTLEYGTKIKGEDYYPILYKNKNVLIKLSPKTVDTMKVGIKQYTVKTDENKEIPIKIKIEDTQNPILIGPKTFEVLNNTSFDNLKEVLSSNITAKDEIDGNIKVEFKYDKNFNLSLNGKQIVKAIATDKNGNETSAEINVIVISQETFEKEYPNNNNDKVIIKDNTAYLSANENNNSTTFSDYEDTRVDGINVKTPSGAKFKHSFNNSIEYYTYEVTLPGGGKITEVAVALDDEFLGAVSGIDNFNQPFNGQMLKSKNGKIISHFRAPHLTPKDYEIIKKTIKSFKVSKK